MRSVVGWDRLSDVIGCGIKWIQLSFWIGGRMVSVTESDGMDCCIESVIESNRLSD